jgi:hypothetical protein
MKSERVVPYLLAGDRCGSGQAFFESWYAWAIGIRLDPLKKVARMLKCHLDRFQTWVASPISNGVAEGFNSRIQSIKSAARGFRLFENLDSESPLLANLVSHACVGKGNWHRVMLYQINRLQCYSGFSGGETADYFWNSVRC